MQSTAVSEICAEVSEICAEVSEICAEVSEICEGLRCEDRSGNLLIESTSLRN
jgi:hypothetical protein